MNKETFQEKSERLRGLYKAGRITHEEYEKWMFSDDLEFTPEILPEEELPMPPTESYRMDFLDFSKALVGEDCKEEEKLKSVGKGIFEQIREAEPVILRGGVTSDDIRKIAKQLFYKETRTK